MVTVSNVSPGVYETRSVSVSAAVSGPLIKVIEKKYTGTDPATHLWAYSVGERGAKIYRLLYQGTASDSQEDAEI